jgi:flagellar assembly protein FliH
MMLLLSKVIKSGQIRFNASVFIPNFLPGAVENAGDWADRQETVGRPLGNGDLPSETERKCAEILAGALKEREAILQQARLEIVVQEQEARQAGYDAGYLDGQAEGLREAGRLRQEAEEFLREAIVMRKLELFRVEPEIVRLSVAIAERLLGRQLTLLPETIVTIVSQALQEARQYSKVLVRVHPDDLPVCRAFAGELAESLRETADLDFIGDKTLACGDCLVETEGALLECRLGERLAALQESLTKLAAERLSGKQGEQLKAAAQ